MENERNINNFEIPREKLSEIALSEEEYRLIVEKLGRPPNVLELGLFGALWSEHCGYKNSKLLLESFPTEGERVLTKTGAENAGAVDIGDGLVVVFKVESHNHPSAIEPYQGAATGVGGIIRDIFTMGARPIALLDSLRFGELDSRENKYLFTGVVSGIAGYGNCVGIPTVGGEVYFEDSYSANPLVNAMCVGVCEVDKLISAKAEGSGNKLFLVGASTGKDGIHGASGLASTTDPKAKFEELRPAVQIGDPFMEKLLMEACLELATNHKDEIVGICDLGAAGLTTTAVESAARGGSGVRIDVSLVHRREEGMSAYDVMLSESQERMLIIVKRGSEDEVSQVLRSWELDSSIIGEVTDSGRIEVFDDLEKKADLPINVLVDPPLYRRVVEEPKYLEKTRNFDFETLPDVSNANKALLELLSAPNIASKIWVYGQYDHHLGTNTVFEPGKADAALLRIKGTKKAISVSIDGNGRMTYLNPFVGGAMAVAEAARNVVCTGATPIGLTNCLNFGSPENEEVYWQLKESIKGMAEAARALDIPVVSGNVSLYNETGGKPIYPTPVVGVVGLLEDVDNRVGMKFKEEGDVVFLLGSGTAQLVESLAGSEYLKVRFGTIGGDPKIDLERERGLQKCILALAREKVIHSAHDCSEGGLAVALAECVIAGELGLDASQVSFFSRRDAVLFGEVPSRGIVSVSKDQVDKFIEILQGFNLPYARIGLVGGEKLRIGDAIDLEREELRNIYENSLEEKLSH